MEGAGHAKVPRPSLISEPTVPFGKKTRAGLMEEEIREFQSLFRRRSHMWTMSRRASALVMTLAALAHMYPACQPDAIGTRRLRTAILPRLDVRRRRGPLRTCAGLAGNTSASTI